MADIKEVIEELETIANAFTSVKSFNYGYESEININRVKAFPHIHISNVHPYDQPKGFFEARRNYLMTIWLYDLYPIEEQKTVTEETKRGTMENILEQYVREFISRSQGETAQVTTIQDWTFIHISFRADSFKDAHNDKLVGIEATMTLEVVTDCDTGTFNY